MTDLHMILGHQPSAYLDGPHKWDELMGIELELENVYDPDESYEVEGWTRHSDASLRNGIEYVTSPAMGGQRLDAAIRSFFRKRMTYDNGPRTSTHIHVNMRDSTSENLAAMVMIVYMIEDGIYQSVEEARKWGGYSVSLGEMPTTRLRSLIAPVSDMALSSAISPSRNAERYYGLNTNMRRHGTVEFRYFPGGPTEKELRLWVDLVVAIKKACKKYSPEDLINTIISPTAVVKFLTDEFGEWGHILLNAVGPDRMFNAFAEVATMAGDEDSRELASSVMWVTPAYMDFLSKTVLKDQPEAIAYLSNVISKSNVLSKADWNYYYQNAPRTNNAKLKKNLYDLGQAIQREEDEDEDYDDGDSWSPEPDEVAAPSLNAYRDPFQSTEYQETIARMQRATANIRAGRGGSVTARLDRAVGAPDVSPPATFDERTQRWTIQETTPEPFTGWIADFETQAPDGEPTVTLQPTRPVRRNR